jgi:CBS domain-containing protein
MHYERIGSILVINEQSGIPFGIFTERDLLIKVLSKQARIEGELLANYCTSPLIVAHIGVNARDAANIMAVSHVKRLPLTKNEKVVAIVAARDLVASFVSNDNEEEQLQNRQASVEA